MKPTGRKPQFWREFFASFALIMLACGIFKDDPIWFLDAAIVGAILSETYARDDE